jgi:O-antigen ligase
MGILVAAVIGALILAGILGMIKRKRRERQNQAAFHQDIVSPFFFLFLFWAGLLTLILLFFGESSFKRRIRLSLKWIERVLAQRGTL